MKKTEFIEIIREKINSVKIIFSIIIIFLLMQNISFSRYYTLLDTITVKFTIDENINIGVNKNYENK